MTLSEPATDGCLESLVGVGRVSGTREIFCDFFSILVCFPAINTFYRFQILIVKIWTNFHDQISLKPVQTLNRNLCSISIISSRFVWNFHAKVTKPIRDIVRIYITYVIRYGVLFYIECLKKSCVLDLRIETYTDCYIVRGYLRGKGVKESLLMTWTWSEQYRGRRCCPRRHRYHHHHNHY